MREIYDILCTFACTLAIVATMEGYAKKLRPLVRMKIKNGEVVL